MAQLFSTFFALPDMGGREVSTSGACRPFFGRAPLKSATEKKRDLAIDTQFAEQAIDDVMYDLPSGLMAPSAPPPARLPGPGPILKSDVLSLSLLASRIRSLRMQGSILRAHGYHGSLLADE